MTERELFLRALAENEDDVATRLVYSDWLDEQGECEEADRQRKWPAAKEWLLRFLERSDPDADPEDYSYEDLIEVGRIAIPRSGENIYIEEDVVDLLTVILKDLREFSQRWSIVTGIALPPDLEEKSYYWRCCENEEYHIGGPFSRQPGENEEAGDPTDNEIQPANDDLNRLQDDLERDRTKRRP